VSGHVAGHRKKNYFFNFTRKSGKIPEKKEKNMNFYLCRCPEENFFVLCDICVEVALSPENPFPTEKVRRVEPEKTATCESCGHKE
jgi:hypothetical protein